ncbi:protein phosphatase 4, regulatory subunit 4 [Nesidiocoris tenuis]|nr:protein phosphatase 4, regulatory subunit 4 [Nesidiocoris tenuis]
MSRQSSDLSFSFERMSAKDLKSAEQIRRHSIDSRYEGKNVERAIQIFTVGDEVQKMSVVNSLPELLTEDRSSALNNLMPKTLQCLSGGSTEYHVAMSASILIVLKDRVVPLQMFIDNFLQVVLQNMDHKDMTVANAWCDVLIEAIQCLPVDALKQHVTQVALQRTHMIKPPAIRMSSCTIIGELALRYDLATVKKDLIPAIITLSQDLDVNVRVALANNLTKVIKSLKAETFRTSIGNTLVELATDEMLSVKDATFRTICNVLDVISLENVKNNLVPVIKQMIHFGFKNDDSLLLGISAGFGKLCLGIDKVTTEKELFVKYYVTIATMGSMPSRRKASAFPEPAFHIVHTSLDTDRYFVCRQSCANNYPAMCKFVEGNTQLIELLHGALNELNTDSCYAVRRAVAAVIGETCVNLGKSAHLIKNNLLQLLLDESEDVLDTLFPNLAAVIDNLMKIGVYKIDPPPKDTSVADLNKAILRCENVIAPSHNWRLYSMFMSQIECLYKILPSDILFNNYITPFLRRIHGTRSVPVRMSLMRTILVFLRYLQKPAQRSEVRSRIINEFCLHSVFFNRIFYLRSCHLIFEIFSTHYFKEYFFIRTIMMVDDPVPNVRWALLMMLPKLRQMVKHPNEKKMMALVDQALAKLADDKDKEINRQYDGIKAILDVPDQKLLQNDAKKFEEEKKIMGTADSGRPGDIGGGGT